MRLTELFTDELFVEHDMQKKYIECVELMNIFNSMTEEERLGEMIDIWRSWSDGEGKAYFLRHAGMSMTRAHNLLSNSANKIQFEDYARFKSVGKDYAVITQKYNLDEKTKTILDRYRRIKKKEKETT